MVYPVRIVFQGGGARFATLLAAAHAIETVANKPNTGLRLEEVAGVSAGAIAASALSVRGLPAIEVAKRIRQHASPYIERARQALNEIETARSKSWNSSLAWASIAKKVWEGKPVLSSEDLQELLSKAFRLQVEGSQSREALFTDMAYPTTLFTTDLGTGESTPHESRRLKNKRVAELVTASASMPFVFTSFLHGTTADGGVTGNLPVGFFHQNKDSEARIISFSFGQERRNPGDALSYGAALLGSAMDASVREAERLTEEAGGKVIRLESPFGTFDFIDAINLGLDDGLFVAASAKIREQFEHALNEIFGGPTGHIVEKRNVGRLRDLAHHKRLRESFPFIVVESNMILVDGHCRDGSPPYVPRDETTFVVKFEAGKEGLLAAQVGLPFGGPGVWRPRCEVLDRDGKAILGSEAVIFSERLPGSPDRYANKALVFLGRYVPREEGPITVFLSCESDDLASLKRNGWDVARTRSSTPDRSVVERWLLVVPPSVDLELSDLSTAKLTEAQLAEIPGQDERAKDWSPGRACDARAAEELFTKLYLFRGTVAAERQFFGWEINEFRPGSSGGFLIRDKSRGS